MNDEELKREIEKNDEEINILKKQLREGEKETKELANAHRILANRLWQEQNLVLYDCPLCDKLTMGCPNSVVYCECGQRAERFMENQ